MKPASPTPEPIVVEPMTAGKAFEGVDSLPTGKAWERRNRSERIKFPVSPEDIRERNELRAGTGQRATATDRMFWQIGKAIVRQQKREKVE